MKVLTIKKMFFLDFWLLFYLANVQIQQVFK